VKVIPINLQAHYDGGSTTLAYGLKVTRADAQVYAFTSADSDQTVGGVVYLSGPGLNISDIVASAGLAVDNLELSTLDDGSTFTGRDVLSGVWRNAAFQIIRFNYLVPTDGVEVLLTGTIGNVSRTRGLITAELRGLQQYLQQPIGNVTSKTCRARLGDSLCGITLATYTFTGTLTSVTNNQTFADSGRAQAADYFTEGILTLTSGANIGLSQKVKGHAAGGVFTMSLPFLSTVAVGNTYSVAAGCRKRLAEDCVAKFGNALNFQGEPHLPGIDQLTSPP